MATKTKRYKVTAEPGVVGFKGVIHATGDIVESNRVPEANLKAWLRFGQVEEVKSEPKEKPADASAGSEKEGGAK